MCIYKANQMTWRENTHRTTDPLPTTAEPEPSHTTIEIAQLLSGLKEKVPSKHVTPQVTHQTGEMPLEVDMDVDIISPN